MSISPDSTKNQSPNPPKPLNQNHLDMLHKSAISDDVIKERGYFSEDDEGKIHDLGFASAQSRPGLVIPLWTVDGQIGTYILHPDNPRCLEDKKKPRNPDGTYPQKILKYEMPKGSGLRIDCPSRCQPKLGNPGESLWITEGIKKGDALASAGFTAIDLLGVWGGKGKNDYGASTWLADWGYIALKDRQVNIVFDSDIMTNENVKGAFDNLKAFLTNKGAKVYAVYLPSSPDGKLGVDDWLAASHTAEELKAMVTLPQDSTYKPKVTSEDYYRIFEKLTWTFRLNILNDQEEVNGRPMTDIEEAVIFTVMRDLGFTNIPAIRDAITALAFKNHYHPIKDYLTGLPEYDGRPYIKTLADCIKSSNSNVYAWLTHWFIGAVRRVIEGGTQNRMLVLAGPQNCGKSKLVSWLCPMPLHRYFLASPISPEIKDQKIELMSTWIWEVAELGNTTRKADRGALKYFLSLEWVKERLPYGRRPVTKPALTSFIGTLNDEGGVLNDSTGSRRFMFIKVDSIDWRRYTTELTPDLIWAEAHYRYLQGESADLTAEEAVTAAEGNSEFDAENAVEGLMLKYYKVEPNVRTWWTPTQEIVKVLLDPEYGAYHGTSDKLTSELSSVLTGLGCLKVRKTSWTNPDTDKFDYSSKVTGYFGVIRK